MVDSKDLSRSAANQIADLNALPGSWDRLFDVSEEDLAQLRQTGLVNRSAQAELLPDYNLFYRLELEDGQSPNQISDQLISFDIVEAVYPVAKAVAPPLPPDYEAIRTDGGRYQRYLDTAPDGIGARKAWANEEYGSGDGIKICDGVWV